MNADLPYINSATGNQYSGDNANHWAIRGMFARLNYVYNGRYLLEFNGRYDGTSRFPQADRFKFFPSFQLVGEFLKKISCSLCVHGWTI